MKHSLFTFLVIFSILFPGLFSPSPFGFPTDAFAGGDGAAISNSGILWQGEDLLYEVTWGIFRLGTIRIKTSQSVREKGEICHRSTAFIDSYGGLPFVDFHSISTSVMDSLFFSVLSRSLERKNGEWWSRQYSFDAKSRLFITEETWQKDLEVPPYTPPTYDTLKLEWDKFQDGASLFFYARANIQKEKSVRVPTVVLGKPGYTSFYFTRTKTTEHIDAVPQAIPVVYLEGKAEFEGVFGLTGDFKGWFSDDEAAIPIKAKMKVILGNVNVELKEWHRAEWKPPQAGE